jgi:hypothetical protein
MSGQVERPSDELLASSGPDQDGRLVRRARDFLVKGLIAKGNEIWSQDRHRIDEAIEKIEQAWSLSRDPRLAVQLATMYDQANQNDQALVVLREAFRLDPHHALVRHHAAITLLRHGGAQDIRDFFESVLAIDPHDAFAQFVMAMLDAYDVWVRELVAAIEAKGDQRRPFIISCPVWGQPFAENFARYLCAALLSANNLPALAKRCAVHVVVFTTLETESYLRADPMFARLGDHAAVHFMRYSESQVKYGAAMEAHYGREPVFYSKNSLAFYYARNCKFVLMSCAHYVALAAGRATDAFVSGQVADTILNDGALALMADLLEGPADAVLINCMQIDGDALRAAFESRCRRADGVLEITPVEATRIVQDHLPDYNFTTAAGLAQIPLRMCWRVGSHAILVHGNHYHPMGLRPKAFDHPLHLSIDPTDSRFVDRSSLARERIHLVQDASIVGLSIEDGPLPEQLARDGPLSIADMAFWLWGYWGRLRGTFFRTPLRFGRADPGEWERTERAAAPLIDAIVAGAAALESKRLAKRSWRLPSTPSRTRGS